MLITDTIFAAFLDCETKSHLMLSGTPPSDGKYSVFRYSINDEYEQQCSVRLRSDLPDTEYLENLSFDEALRTGTFRFAFDCTVQAGKLQTKMFVLERLPLADKENVYDLIPIRCFPNKNISRTDKLLLAFDALVLFVASGRMPPYGKIIHGSPAKTVKVRLSGLMETVENTVRRIAAQQSSSVAPETVLKSHCAECEFQSRCRREATEKDSLSLLSGISEKERLRLGKRGITTVTQLSYTFRPRRKSPQIPAKHGKISFALKALAIRENKIHVSGSPELKITGTPVFLDVEGVPEQDFYYLIGLRYRNGTRIVRHSWWADEKKGEREIWERFLQTVQTVDNPQLIHYGSYETVFLKRMQARYGRTAQDSALVETLLAKAINLLTVIYAQIYFPTYSNGLKDIAGYLGFRWSESEASGFQSLIWRRQWEASKSSSLKKRLINYNREDCEALEKVVEAVARLCRKSDAADAVADEFVRADSLRREYPQRFGKIALALPELETINKAAYWNYQRDKIYLRSKTGSKLPTRKKTVARRRSPPVNKIIECAAPSGCPKCRSPRIFKYGKMSRLVYDLKFSGGGIKRWIVKYLGNRYLCWDCRVTFVSYENSPVKNKFGTELRSFVIYQMIGLKIPQLSVAEIIDRMFDLPVTGGTIHHQKTLAADYYRTAYRDILSRIISGDLIHADETKANIKGKTAYVWILTNLEEVAYIYTETREGKFLADLLQDFKGVLVSDFYAVYDSISCPQQKCLIHLMRDLNDDLLKEPFNEELKNLLKEFAGLLNPIIAAIDRFGLKSRYLRKHRIGVERFYRRLSRYNYQSEIAGKYRKRFEKNREKLFTFLDYDGVPWNNNNAEHAVKAFAKLRHIIGGSSTEKGLRDYLTLLSVSETCRYKNIDFLDFLRSGVNILPLSDVKVFRHRN